MLFWLFPAISAFGIVTPTSRTQHSEYQEVHFGTEVKISVGIPALWYSDTYPSLNRPIENH